MTMPARIAIAAFFGCAAANGQDLCEISRQPSRRIDQKVSVRARLTLGYHDAALIPTNEAASYRGECALFPLLGATPAGLRAGVREEGYANSTVTRTMRLYREHLASNNPEQWCFLATGIVKAIRNYKYDQAKGKGNGFGYKGYYRIALLMQSLSRAPCDSEAKE